MVVNQKCPEGKAASAKLALANGVACLCYNKKPPAAIVSETTLRNTQLANSQVYFLAFESCN